MGYIMDGKAGGIDKYLLNFLKVNSGNEIQMDFLTNAIDKELQEELLQYGSKLYAIPSLRHPIAQYKKTCEILSKGNYDMAYFNISTAIDGIGAFAAQHMKVKQVAIHSHSSGNDCESRKQRLLYNAVHACCKAFLYKAATEYYGCSNKAGRWLFPGKIVKSKQFQLIYNAVDRSQFMYEPNIRDAVRKELKVENKFVVGHIGNFCYQKNYPYLIKVFQALHQKNPNAVLLLTGVGIELEQVKQDVEDKGLKEVVKFLGWRGDTYRLYQAMDVFVLPSKFEGLPVVGVEAQSTKLSVVFSDCITKEVKIQNHCHFMSLKDTPECWAELILSIQGEKREDVVFAEEAYHYDLKVQQEQLRRLACH